MSFDSYMPVMVDRMGSLVTGYDRKKLSSGVAPVARNVRFGLNFVATRWGVTQTIALPEQASINGLGVLIRAAQVPAYLPLIFTDSGNLYYEFPVGSGIPKQIKPAVGALPISSFMEMVGAYQRAYLSFNDLSQAAGDNFVFDGLNLDPWTQRPVGETWAPGVTYLAGEIVTPIVANGHMYQITAGGVAGNIEPTWPLTAGGNFTGADGVTVQEANIVAANQLPAPPAPGLTRIAGAGTFAANKDVYIITTLVNGKGETVTSLASTILATVLNDRVQVASPAPYGYSGLAAPYAVTGYNVYEADVATGGAAPALASYKKVNAGAVAIGTPTNVDAAGGGAAPPSVNTANIAPAGNICVGLRYFFCFFVNRQGNICGGYAAAAQQMNISAASLEAFLGNIPIGPSYVTARILAFGLPGNDQSLIAPSGPYTYIAKDDNSGAEPILATVIEDNVSTSAYVQFTDAYLSQATDVTDYLRAIKLPPQGKVFFIKTLHRLATVGEAGQPSLVRFSEADLPATFFGDTDFMYVSKNDGQRVYGVGEFKEEVYIAKERAGYVVHTSTGDPIAWKDSKRWEESGPTGFDAIAFGSDFIAWAHESGAYIYMGQDKQWISMEIDADWRKINFAGGGQSIVTVIDEIEKEVHFYVPVGGATSPSKRYTVNYAQGWEEPIQFSSFAGKLVSHPNTRKWSIDDLPAQRAARVYRPISHPDPILAKTQMLIGSNQDDGLVYMVNPGSWGDNGEGIDSYYELAPVGIDDLQLPGLQGGLARLGGFVAAIEGNGEIQASAIDYSNRSCAWDRLIKLTVEPNYYHRRYSNLLSRKWSIGFSNLKTPGSGFVLYDVAVYLKQFRVQEQGVIAASN